MLDVYGPISYLFKHCLTSKYWIFYIDRNAKLVID